MSKLVTALSRGFPARQRLHILLLLLGLAGGALGIVFLVAVPPARPVTLKFPRTTNADGREIVAWEIDNRLPREVWWRIQTGGTNYAGALRLDSYNGNYVSGIWRGMWQQTGESPMEPHSSRRPYFTNPDMRPKSGERVWLVWSAQPESRPVQRGAVNRWRLGLSHCLDGHGWRRAAALVRPRSNDLHVEELLVP